ncbi:cation diffusion facilitator family transporter [Aliarcobacter butzleri]|uniref:cation diffusion facilitator family transporter n=1 Tax=Aliarcobacter butzleri TaxID=28197 RepID=UPI0021B29E31|nr:cation diffusion facilitator family transporter [Aliarcobacter butzleri]MCT7555615.1 cation diffusion facilitator family transporter [Aliarcobacter butzleri]MCT7562699.1 cation diffusion facilitator family transporter [Aliarcobacter butzleri]MCT7603226.1 cation diffusion facilitator family transporter [Aliarcobacter butzleri]MCT7612860.1 cation diffusion facilitator family transporter [Aliarcobacter butzleri]MCT7622591.1 cation diffusion facilitator family transporter [Aliarcobacter butzler
MANCGFGLNEHKPFLDKESEHHHHHDHKHKLSNKNLEQNIEQKFVFSAKQENHIHSHEHGCGHDHGVARHTHDHRGTDKKVLKWALSITLITMFLEFFYGFLSNSLALISDAIHMFTHSFALIISLFAIIIASKTAPISKTFGYYRAEVLAAFINGITIVLSIIWIIYEAIERFLNPQVIDIKTAMIVAIIGLIVNIITGVILMQGDKDNINLKSAFIHMLTDALSSVAIIIGYIVIYFTSWYFIDIILAVIVALVIAKWAIDILKSSTNTLLESSPIDVKEVQEYIEKNEKVLELHDVHIWEITQDMYNMTAHVKIDKKYLDDYEEILHKINRNLKEKFKIVHTTFQFEW